MAETSKSDGSTVAPQHVPPARLNDPVVRRKLACLLNPKRPKDGYYQWNRILRGRLPKLADYAVARALAVYSNADGSSCRPGLDRLADDLCTSTKSVQRSLDYLTENGWISLMNPGVRKRGEANEYSLSVPAPTGVEVGVWDESDGAQWIERPANWPRHTTGHRRPPNPSLGGHSRSQGGHGRPGKVDTGVQPPTQVTTPLPHHADSLNRPHADARGQVEMIDPDSLEASEQIAAEAETLLGFEISVFTHNLIDSMLAEGRAVQAIVNTAVARERDGAGNPF